MRKDKALKMFADLGYTKHTAFEGNNVVMFGPIAIRFVKDEYREVIDFNLITKKVSKYRADRAAARGEVDTNLEINVKELKAINRQIKELGW